MVVRIRLPAVHEFTSSGDEMNRYKITNTKSGHCLGTFAALTESDAIEVMARDAGYASAADAADALGTTVDATRSELSVELESLTVVTLGRDGMGATANEADFEAWVAFVAERLEGATVEVAHASDVQTDRISGEASDLREQLACLWDTFCSSTDYWPAQ